LLIISTEAVYVLIALCVLGLGMLYALNGPLLSDQWVVWIIKAALAAAVALSIGMASLGLPGAIFLELVGQKLRPDSAWPLALMITQVGALLIIPASLLLRLAMPGLVGLRHGMMTALLTMAAIFVFAVLVAGADPRP
jgi:hypothetical protein